MIRRSSRDTAFHPDPAILTLTYANAGHCPPWLIRGKKRARLESLTPPVGLLANVEAEEVSLTLDSGDWLVITSDGIAEAIDDDGEEFGDLCLLAVVDSSHTPHDLCSASLDAVTSFAGHKPADDLTILAARVLLSRPQAGT